MILMKIPLLQKKYLIFIIPAILLLLLIIAAVPGAVYREHVYRNGMKSLHAGDLETAETVLSEIPLYRDSDTILNSEIPYLRASRLKDAADSGDADMLGEAGYSSSDLNSGTTARMLLYTSAQEAFESLGAYKDSAALAEACREGYAQEVQRLKDKAEAELLRQNQETYDRALALLEEGSYSKALSLFENLDGFSDSKAMVTECRYRKAVSIFHFLSAHDVTWIFASISMDPDVTSIFSLPAEEALRLGSASVDELRASCGKDATDIRLEDTPTGQLAPLKDALKDLFLSLGDYADSASFPEQIEKVTDYTRDFFMLCSTGDLYAAKDWLDSFDGVFPDRERWENLLSIYLPYCGYWELYLGDSSLLAFTLGQDFTSNSLSTRVILTRDTAVLRLSFGDGLAWNVDLPGELGETLFINSDLDSGYYMGALNNGHFVYMRYSRDWDSLLSSCDYSPA